MGTSSGDKFPESGDSETESDAAGSDTLRLDSFLGDNRLNRAIFVRTRLRLLVRWSFRPVIRIIKISTLP